MLVDKGPEEFGIRFDSVDRFVLLPFQSTKEMCFNPPFCFTDFPIEFVDKTGMGGPKLS